MQDMLHCKQSSWEVLSAAIQCSEILLLRPPTTEPTLLLRNLFAISISIYTQRPSEKQAPFGMPKSDH